jgi:hypothetical protein
MRLPFAQFGLRTDPWYPEKDADLQSWGPANRKDEAYPLRPAYRQLPIRKWRFEKLYMRTGLEEREVVAFGYKLGHADGALVQYFSF